MRICPYNIKEVKKWECVLTIKRSQEMRMCPYNKKKWRNENVSLQ